MTPTTRLLFYFFATFFSSFGAGVAENMSAEAWVRLIVLSFAAACAAVVAYLDRSSGSGPTAGQVARVALVIFALAWAGCSTRVYGANGRPQLVTYADVKGLRWRGPGTALDIAQADHSAPTRAGFNGVTSAITAAGAAAAGLR